MLFCNFLRINPQLVVQKLIGPQKHHFIVRDAIFFAGGANTVPNSEKKCNRQFKHRAAVNKLFKMAMLTEDTAQDFWDLGKNTFSFSGFSLQYMDSGGKAELVACAFLAVELKLPVLNHQKNRKKTMMQDNLGFKEKEVRFCNSFVYSSFKLFYCPLVYDFCSCKKCMEKIQEQALRLLHNNFTSDYAELLKK